MTDPVERDRIQAQIYALLPHIIEAPQSHLSNLIAVWDSPQWDGEPQPGRNRRSAASSPITNDTVGRHSIPSPTFAPAAR
jgi:hypothetical protein